MRILVLCSVALLACISVNQATPKSNWRNSQDDVAVRVVTWPPKSGGRDFQDNNGKTFQKVLADPLRWVSAKDSQRYFENTDGLNWVEMQVGKEPNMFTEVWRKGSDSSLVVVLKRSDKLYVKLSEGMAWWSWNMGFPEKYQIGEGSWKKVDSTRKAVEVIGPYKIISREKKDRYAIPGRKSADSNTKALASPYKWQDSKDSSHYFVKKDGQTWTEMLNGAASSLNFVKVLAGNQNDPMTFEVLLKRDKQSYVKLTNMHALWGSSETSTNTKFASGYWVTTRASQKGNKQMMNPPKLGSKDCRPSEDAKKNFLKFVLERDSKRVYRRTLKADDVCATTCNEQKLLWTGSWGAVEPKDVVVCECRDPRVSSRVSNFDRHSKEVDASECEAVFCESVVDLHNKMRVKHQVDKLTVDASLSTAASVYAKKLVSIGELRHSNLSDVGENLAYRVQTPPHRLTYKYCKKLGDQVTRMWYDEVEQYDFATGQAKTSNADVSHFTQLVWADSSKVGCGLAIDSTETRQKFFGVVRYSPPGNVGQYVDNVKPASRLMSAVNWP